MTRPGRGAAGAGSAPRILREELGLALRRPPRVRITVVDRDSLAAQAGLKSGDSC